jgi:hypothetical protein
MVVEEVNVSGQEVATGVADPAVMITVVGAIFVVIFIVLVGYAIWKAVS